MAATNYTPISLYYSTTASAAPSAGNLVAGELALNTLDEKLYFKNSAGTVKLLASNSASSGTVSSVAATVPAFLSIAGSPITTSGTLAITYSGTALPVANGGTGLTSGTSGGVLAYTASGTLASSGALTQYGVVLGGGAGAVPTSTAVGTATYVLTSNGSGVAPTFQAPAAGASGANPTATVSGSAVNGSAVTFMRSDAAPALANTAVTPASYTNASITVDAQGRITAASSGAGASAATPTALGTVYGNTTTTGNSLTALGYTAGSNNTGSNTVAIGYQALSATSSAGYNTAVGYQSLQATTSGDFNTAVGTLALKANTTGTNNVAFGQQTLLTNTVGAYNTALGAAALYSNTADNNTAVGNFAGTVVSSGANNTLLGFQAGYSGTNNLTTGSNNILIGYNATATSASVSNQNTFGNSSTTSNRFWGDMKMAGANAGSSGEVLTSAGAGVAPTWAAVSASAATPTALGTVYGKTTAGSTTFLGYNAGSATTGNNNVYFGDNAGAANTTGYRNTIVGSGAFGTNTIGGGNVVVGYQAGYYISTGDDNTIIGNQAGGSGSFTGSRNICIGYTANPSTGSVSDTATIGTSAITVLRCAVTTITAISDARDKTNILPIAAGLDFTNQLNPVSFDWNMRDGGKVGVSDTGFIAQDLQAVQEKTGIEIPGLVYADNPEKLEAGYSKLLPVMVKAIQELSAKIDALQAEITQLKGA